MLSKVLTDLMKKEGLTVTQLAKKSNVPVANLHNWLNGGNPSVKQLLIISEFFNVTTDYLLTGNSIDPIQEILQDKFQVFTGKYEITINRIVEKKLD